MPPAVAESKVPTEPRLLALDAATDAGACGHKAATLAQLRNLGFDVPDGFVIPAGVQVSCEEIATALARLGDGPMAVRSSGVAEDLPDASFAGQYDTLLNVRGAEAVMDTAAACVKSAHDGRIESYGHAIRPMAVTPATSASIICCTRAAHELVCEHGHQGDWPRTLPSHRT